MLELELAVNLAHRQGEYCWHFDLPIEILPGDDEAQPRGSNLQLLEDGVPLGPAHSVHEEVRTVGFGAYSHWKRELFCSTSDNSDLRRNGRRYSVRAEIHQFKDPDEAYAHLAAAFRALSSSRHNYTDMSVTEFDSSITLALNTVEQILDTLPAKEREIEVLRLSARLDKMRASVFEDINNFSRASPVYDEGVKDYLNRFRNSHSIHLELGTYSSWPRERVEAYVEDRALGDFISLDMNPDFGPDVAASVTALPFADESIDVISSNSLLEHVPYPHDAIREAFRVLRPGGVMCATVPFHFVAHGCPNDYLRYTGEFFEEVCKSAGFETVLTDTWASSGVYSTIHQLLKGSTAARPEVSTTGSAAQRVHLTMMALLAALQSFDDEMDDGGANHWIGTRALAVKSGNFTARPMALDRSRPFLERYAHALICPATGLPLRVCGETLSSADGSQNYDIVDGIPNLFVMHGFGSSFASRASSRDKLAAWEELQANA